MTEAQIRNELTDIFRDAFDDDEMVLSGDMSADTVEGWDSLKMISILIAVETRFGTRLTSKEVDGLRTVDDLVTLIEAKIG